MLWRDKTSFENCLRRDYDYEPQRSVIRLEFLEVTEMHWNRRCVKWGSIYRQDNLKNRGKFIILDDLLLLEDNAIGIIKYCGADITLVLDMKE